LSLPAAEPSLKAHLNFGSESCQHGHQNYLAGPSLTCDTWAALWF